MIAEKKENSGELSLFDEPVPAKAPRKKKKHEFGQKPHE
jgi:hypothetical protein